MSKSVTGDIIAHLGDNRHVNVFVDGDVDFDDMSQFQPLTDFEKIDDVFAASVEEPDDPEVALPPNVVKTGKWSEATVIEALKYALEHKEVPPVIEYGSEFHIEFIYGTFVDWLRKDG